MAGNVNITNLIRQIAPRYGADPRLLIAVAKVESGLNPSAVGDGGTSFGLFQNHVGGAGGPTLASARQYLDPVRAITNAAQRFKGLSSPVDAYNAQRPADRAGYIAKVSSALAGTSAALNAPVTGGGVASGAGPATPMIPQVDPKKAFAMRVIFRDKPIMQSLFSMMEQRKADAASAAMGSLQSPQAPQGIGGAPMVNGPTPGSGYKALSSWVQNNYGLPITSTTGGQHAPGSFHYQGKAVDVGLGPGGAKMAAYAKAHPGEFLEFFGPMNWHIDNGRLIAGAFPDHGDHYHVAR